MFDPPITDAANIFIIISVGLVAVGSAIFMVDVYKTTILKKKNSDKK
ncbi:MAG: hypothetical protein KAR17_12140 [Cyclobacteriaceae bacterium]|nr:hypothetical protein [Cyclobacteriaceae bacterium]